MRDEVGSGHSIWKANTENALGQATSIYKGGKETTYGYDPVNHQVTSIQAAGVINYTYGYYAADGTNHANNLEWRTDGITNQTEHFTYDPQNRLTHWDVTRNGQTTYNSMSFDDVTGNIISKSGIETDPDHLLTMYYGGKNPNGSTTGRPDATNSAIGPHALSTIAGVPANFPSAELNVTYTDFKKIKTLTEDNKYYELTYGVDDQRRVSVYKENDVTKETRYYLGGYEERTDDLTGITEKIHYLSGAIYIERSNGTNNLYYTYSDAQGSLIALSDDAGTLVQRYAYDSWGARRNPDNWTLAATPPSGGWGAINRGYTGHEHLDAFGIINMNGRVYDPLTAQFFSPDPFIQAPGDWLNYNRYGYCINNPLKYTDPTGDYALIDDIIAMIGGGTINLVSNWHKGISFGEGLSYFLIGAGALNSIAKQGFSGGNFNINNIDWGKVAYSGIMSGVTSYLGGQLGQTLHVDKWFTGIDSPLLQNLLRSVSTNTIVGGTLGGFGALVDNDPNTTFWGGAWDGVKMGAVTGTISGIGAAAQYSIENKVNFLTGNGNSLSVSLCPFGYALQ